jgi:hypothetical protein
VKARRKSAFSVRAFQSTPAFRKRSRLVARKRTPPSQAALSLPALPTRPA